MYVVVPFSLDLGDLESPGREGTRLVWTPTLSGGASHTKKGNLSPSASEEEGGGSLAREKQAGGASTERPRRSAAQRKHTQPGPELVPGIRFGFYWAFGALGTDAMPRWDSRTDGF